jgi:hypothetical protein
VQVLEATLRPLDALSEQLYREIHAAGAAAGGSGGNGKRNGESPLLAVCSSRSARLQYFLVLACCS